MHLPGFFAMATAIASTFFLPTSAATTEELVGDFIDMATDIAGTIFPQPNPATKVELVGDLITMSDDGFYPRVLVLEDSTILAGYSSKRGAIVRPSHDNGKTWGEETIVLAPHPPPNKTEDFNNVFLYQLPNKNILCTYRRHIRTPDKKRILELNIEVYQSTDGGKTWGFLSSIYHDVRKEGAIGVWEPFLRMDMDGKLEVYWSFEKSPKNQDSVKRVSKDNGKTWGPILTELTGGGLEARDGMVGIVAQDKANKDLLMVLETNVKNPMKVWALDSTTGGGKWGNRRIIFDPTSEKHPKKQAGGPAIVKVNGTMVVSFMTDQDAPTGDAYPNYKEGVHMKVITSGDDGKTWGEATTAIKNASWGAVTVVGDEVMVVGAQYLTGKAVAQKIIIR
ncbi:glycoside hydrolase family 93 protein [Periconia macrospinosa]|uniref:Glycoside hydrolase family 93 protein n=1 Tax=Periconia macrospinosa TaxID=97972 RepID=A0A2V1DTE9_9PLEO|nr:glycoside hydrolase family 93 protein [Periconia macrospinosa]